ncbi:type 4 pilus major pilin [Pseudoduganella chitinolytica]|uniref:Type 4 pilus major pilin n=1 Tax=Pseudoduganella chitinolytica TaxID=34070 RepID=A0ABY8B8J1_9BURK|nr:type 4 pilus major pilin [Pseudoduganella chitinolytica]WEF32247.1 type 4 pilus major pilin [Pseudoduganella chitinolytica]
MNSMHQQRNPVGAIETVTRPFDPRRQRGASLLEAIAYLGVAAVVVLGAVSLLNGAFGSAKANQTSEEVVSLRTAVRKLYLGQTYGTDNNMNTALVAANVVPSTLTRGDAGSITNSWGGAVTVTGNTATFTISYAGLPKDVCMNVVSGASGWSSINQGNKKVESFPVKAADAEGVCNGTTNAVTFTAS